MSKAVISFITVLMILFSCQHKDDFEDEKQLIKNTLPSLGKRTKINFIKRPDEVQIEIIPEKIMFVHDKHSKLMLSYLLSRLHKEYKPINTVFNLRNGNNQMITLRYDKSEISSICKLYNDTLLSNMVKYVVINFNEYDASALDSYVNRVIMDFPTITNGDNKLDFYTVFEMFYQECLKNEIKGEGQNIFTVLYSMDKELDLLESKNRYSKLIKGIWSIASNISIQKSEKLIFPDI